MCPVRHFQLDAECSRILPRSASHKAQMTRNSFCGGHARLETAVRFEKAAGLGGQRLRIDIKLIQAHTGTVTLISVPFLVGFHVVHFS